MKCIPSRAPILWPHIRRAASLQLSTGHRSCVHICRHCGHCCSHLGQFGPNAINSCHYKLSVLPLVLPVVEQLVQCRAIGLICFELAALTGRTVALCYLVLILIKNALQFCGQPLSISIPGHVAYVMGQFVGIVKWSQLAHSCSR